MKLVDKLKKDLQGEIITLEELDVIMRGLKYRPTEVDVESNNVIKFTNRKSFLNVAVICNDHGYTITDITMSNKKRGITRVRAFHKAEEIKSMMDWFRENEQYDNFLVFMLGMFLARRVVQELHYYIVSNLLKM